MLACARAIQDPVSAGTGVDFDFGSFFLDRLSSFVCAEKNDMPDLSGEYTLSLAFD